MPEIIETTVYRLDELTDDAKDIQIDLSRPTVLRLCPTRNARICCRHRRCEKGKVNTGISGQNPPCGQAFEKLAKAMFESPFALDEPDRRNLRTRLTEIDRGNVRRSKPGNDAVSSHDD
jgi:hypothetical protein